MARTYTKKTLEEHHHTVNALIPQTISGTITPNLIQEEDPWIEMPPHSVRNVVMNVEYMGRAKPLGFDLDDVEEDSCEEDPWVEMPPRSIRKVVMNVKRMGRGKPLEFDLDSLLEDCDSLDDDIEG